LCSRVTDAIHDKNDQNCDGSNNEEHPFPDYVDSEAIHDFYRVHIPVYTWMREIEDINNRGGNNNIHNTREIMTVYTT